MFPKLHTRLQIRRTTLPLVAPCGVCGVDGANDHMDGDLREAVCARCAPFVIEAERNLLAAGLVHSETYLAG